MKIIASRTDRKYGSSPDTFIVEISIDEIKKVANHANYQEWKEEDTKKLLAPGMEYDIAAGYDFRNEIVHATKAMAAGFENFAKAAETMRHFVNLIQKQEPVT